MQEWTKLEHDVQNNRINHKFPIFIPLAVNILTFIIL